MLALQELSIIGAALNSGIFHRAGLDTLIVERCTEHIEVYPAIL
jgi:hypothetical protein